MCPVGAILLKLSLSTSLKLFLPDFSVLLISLNSYFNALKNNKIIPISIVFLSYKAVRFFILRFPIVCTGQD
uniref:Uncharacterized protein n=1 Tax=Arundo donax TaxID=35708 RepID=A0A0A9G0L7_ARUDO